MTPAKDCGRRRPHPDQQLRTLVDTAAEPPAARSAPDTHVSQHETGAAGAADAVAKVVGRGPRLGADSYLIEGVAAAAAHHRAQQAWVLIADHGAQAFHRARIHRQRLVAVEACG